LTIVLAAPVSTRTYGISIETPEWVSVAVTKARSCRKVSCTDASDAQPESLFEFELGLARVDEAELAMRILAMQLGVSHHCRSTVCAKLDDYRPIENAMAVRAMRGECLDHQPAIWMRLSDVSPLHASEATGPL
jgi:hypothetical protein